uniref:Selenide, water dikinase (Trinotate prediction) n=1 Tax=Henneguya salminicola TaxID=69463 RepID=A0A6G3MHK8_HENSL
MSEKEKEIVIPLIMRGFSDTALESGSTVTGGQTVKNPWMLLGGVATSVVESEKIIPYSNAAPSDVLVLTKPLGTRLVGNAYQWYDQKLPRWDKIKHILTPEELIKLYLETAAQMAHLNLDSAREMHNHNARACTDVTGFGLLGHAENLVSFQKQNVSFVIHTLPLLQYTKEISEHCEIDFKLMEGYCAETSGGLFIAMPKFQADDFCLKMKQKNGSDGAWIVGDVIEGQHTAEISKNPIILSVAPVF